MSVTDCLRLATGRALRFCLLETEEEKHSFRGRNSTKGIRKPPVPTKNISEMTHQQVLDAKDAVIHRLLGRILPQLTRFWLLKMQGWPFFRFCFSLTFP